MKIFVTGGAGFIGSNFIHYMIKKYPDYKIVNFDKLTYAGNLENLYYEDNDNYEFVQGNIYDIKAVRGAMEGCDWVVHFAAESHVDRSITGPEVFVVTNVLGTQVLLDVAREKKIKRFHHVSTDEVFGSLSLDNLSEKFNELTPYNPHSPYSASKAGSDHLVRAYYDTYGLATTVSNCSNNYGPYHFPEKVIPLFITNALGDKPLPVYGTGKAVRDYLYVEDHCRAIDMILIDGLPGETYCIGGDSERNGIQVAESILKVLAKPKSLISFVEDRKGHDMRYAIDHTKITKKIGWKPSVSFEDGIKMTVDWYKENQKWWERIISKEYLDTQRREKNLA